MGEMVERFAVQIHAYVLMPNHYHLLLRTRDANLSKAIHWLGVSYSVWFNKRHERSGHLFQGRFKSFLVEDERYLAAMAFYIHGNPLRAGLTTKLDEYPWSSYRAYAGIRKKPPWLSADLILPLFGGTAEGFEREQQAHLRSTKKVLDDLRCGSFLGSEEFARQCEDRLGVEELDEKPQGRLLLRARGVSETARRLFEALSGDGEETAAVRGKQRPLRDAVIFALTRLGCFSNREIGRVFGIGYTGVTEAAKRGARYVAEHESLRARFEEQQL